MDTTTVNVPLTSNDRCDNCGAQAYVQVFFESHDLLFCAHHFKESEEKLIISSTRIYDELHKLEPQRYTPQGDEDEVE